MARTKQIGKRTRVDPDAPPAPPRLSQMPVESWFEEDDQRTAYQERLSRMEILVPKYLAEDVLPEAEFQEFWRLIDVQGLRQFISMRERYYPRLVAAAYTTMSIFDTLRADGTEEDLPIIWAMAQGKQINWPYLIAHKMVKYSRGTATANLGHAHLWTRILESLDFDLTRERVIEPSKVNAIVRKNINQMRRNLLGPADEGGDDEDEAMEDVPPTFEAGTSSQIPTEAEAPPQFQPDYAELI
ncbi:hypothetical protein PIB30_105673 [Stylosanthes scabra]|uniref:Uncharacterized protein n=1 Tax=Stylosanthes scabra TaxID=79078 RepID=A0ABU6SZ44_9FABA|nr:hypothetical protein [Stylosanthes scabra]